MHRGATVKTLTPAEASKPPPPVQVPKEGAVLVAGDDDGAAAAGGCCGVFGGQKNTRKVAPAPA